jgi:hypothetical protein
MIINKQYIFLETSEVIPKSLWKQFPRNFPLDSVGKDKDSGAEVRSTQMSVAGKFYGFEKNKELK